MVRGKCLLPVLYKLTDPVKQTKQTCADWTQNAKDIVQQSKQPGKQCFFPLNLIPVKFANSVSIGPLKFPLKFPYKLRSTFAKSVSVLRFHFWWIMTMLSPTSCWGGIQ